MERAKPKFERLRTIYLNTLEAMKTNPQTYCRGLAPSPDVSAGETDQLKARADAALNNITFTLSYEEAARDCDLVIEAIAENPEEKIAFYTELAKHLPEKTIIATNSSTMLPSAFAQHAGRPEKYLALHFANEIWRNNTAEVMGHPETSKQAYDDVAEFAETNSMIPLKLQKEQPGYILNSLLVPFLSAAEALLATGVAGCETIDKTWMLATGVPLGPFRILDIVGLTTAYSIGIMDPRSKDPSTVQGKVVALLKGYIDEGETGVNAGEGFYKY